MGSLEVQSSHLTRIAHLHFPRHASLFACPRFHSFKSNTILLIFILFSHHSYPEHRKQAERAARGRQTTRRSTYFDCLVVDFLAKEKEQLGLNPSSEPSVLDKPTSEVASKVAIKGEAKNGSAECEMNYDAEEYRMSGEYPWDDTPFQEAESPARLTAPAPAPAPTHSPIAPPIHSLLRSIGIKDGDVSRSSDHSTKGDPRSLAVDNAHKACGIPRHKAPQLPASVTAHTSATVHAPVPTPWFPVPVSLSLPAPTPTTIPIPVPISIPPVPTSTQPLNYFSLYWIKKSGLPCIRTDWSNGQVTHSISLFPL